MKTRNGQQVLEHLPSARSTLEVYRVNGYRNARNTDVMVTFSQGEYRMDNKESGWDIIKD